MAPSRVCAYRLRLGEHTRHPKNRSQAHRSVIEPFEANQWASPVFTRIFIDVPRSTAISFSFL